MEVENAEENISGTAEIDGCTVIGRTCCENVSDSGDTFDR